MNVSERIAEIFSSFSPVTFQILKSGKRSHLFLIRTESKYRVTVEGANDVLQSFLTETWDLFTNYVDSLSNAQKQKSVALLEAKKRIQSILLKIKHNRFYLRYPEEAWEFFNYTRTDDPTLEYEKIGLLDHWQDLFRTELPFHLENWLVMINHDYQKLQLKIKEKAVLETKSPFEIVDYQNARKRLLSLFNALINFGIIECDLRSFQNVFMGGPVVTKVKWKISAAFLPVFIKELLDTKLVIKRRKGNNAYWDYLLHRFVDKDGQRFSKSLRNTSPNYGSKEDRDRYIFKPLRFLTQV